MLINRQTTSSYILPCASILGPTALWNGKQGCAINSPSATLNLLRVTFNFQKTMLPFCKLDAY